MKAWNVSLTRDDWATPDRLFKRLLQEHGPFDLDPAASESNACAPTFYTKEMDGLSLPWTGRVYCNPPYGRNLHKWVKKGYEAAQQGAYVVMLLPSRTDTGYFHDYVLKGKVEFLRGRLRYNDSKGTATFGSLICVFQKQ